MAGSKMVMEGTFARIVSMPVTGQPELPTFATVRAMIEKYASTLRPTRAERVSLEDAPGRVLAKSIAADRDLPPFPRSARDGFAVRVGDLRDTSISLKVIGELKAGDDAGRFFVGEGECVSIMTGAAVPEGANAVVMVEYATQAGGFVSFQRGAEAGENIVPRGSEARAGQELVAKGMRIGHAVIAAAATVGQTELTVYCRPTVAILATGDELVPIDAAPGPYQIRNSNSFSLAAQVRAAGGSPSILPTAPDDPVRLRELIAEGLQSDLLLLSGGVSMGKYDIVENVLEEFGVRFLFTGALIQPGKPVVFGESEMDGGHRARVFGLPGNPVSTMVTFELFVRPVLESLAGRPMRTLRFTQAKLAEDLRTKPGLTRFLPARLNGEAGTVQVERLNWQGSGDIVTVVQASCYIVVPPDRELIAAGEMVSILIPGADL